MLKSMADITILWLKSAVLILRRDQKEPKHVVSMPLREFLLFGTLCSLLMSCLASKVYWGFFKESFIESVGSDCDL